MFLFFIPFIFPVGGAGEVEKGEEYYKAIDELNNLCRDIYGWKYKRTWNLEDLWTKKIGDNIFKIYSIPYVGEHRIIIKVNNNKIYDKRMGFLTAVKLLKKLLKDKKEINKLFKKSLDELKLRSKKSLSEII